MIAIEEVSIMPRRSTSPKSLFGGVYMDKEKKQRLEDVGVDTDNALERFMGNETMLDKYLNKFISDPHFENMTKAMQEGNCRQAFLEAHALKGLCGNLALKALSGEIGRCVEFLRAEDLSGAWEMKEELDRTYQHTIGALMGYFSKESA